MDTTHREILDLINKDELVDLVLKLGNIASPTGYEKEVGEFLLDWLVDNKLEPRKLEAAPGRFAVTGKVCGKGNGFSLLFNSHMDTWVGGPDDTWILGRETDRYWNEAWLKEDLIVGSGVVNDKGPMAATMLATKALKESGSKLLGDVILTIVPGEIGLAPVDEYQGPQYLGKGLGARHLVEHGVVADYALNAEATNFCVSRTQCGAAYIKINIKRSGDPKYTPYVERPLSANENPNAIIRAMKLIQAIEEWAYKYEQENKREYPDGLVIPKVSIGAIRGGLPYKPSATPCLCSLYVDIRIPPHRDILSVKEELDQAINDTGIEAESEIYLSRKGYEGKNVSTLIEAIEGSYKEMVGEKLGRIDIPFTSMWRDMNVFNEVGIPSVTFGPSSGVGGGGPEAHSIKIDELYLASRLYLLTALNICNRTK